MSACTSGSTDSPYVAAPSSPVSARPSRLQRSSMGSRRIFPPPVLPQTPRLTVTKGHQRSEDAGRDQRKSPDLSHFQGAPPAGFEPARTAPEAAALSPELRGRSFADYSAENSTSAGGTGLARTTRRCETALVHCRRGIVAVPRPERHRQARRDRRCTRACGLRGESPTPT